MLMAIGTAMSSVGIAYAADDTDSMTTNKSAMNSITNSIAYAVYDPDNKELDFIRSKEKYKNKSTGTVKSISGGSYTGTIYTGFEEKEKSYNNYDQKNQTPWISCYVKKVNFIDTIKPKSTAYWFEEMELCDSMDLSKLDTSDVTDMDHMFSFCCSLHSLDLSHFDTSKVTNMNHMFYKVDIPSINFSHFDTSKVTDMGYMFYGSRFKTLDLTHFDTSKVKTMEYMFNECVNLQTVDLSSFNTSNATNMNHMFNGDYSLTSLDVSNFDTSKVEDMSFMFSGCDNQALTAINLGHLDTSNVKNMYQMFSSNWNLTSLDVSSFKTSNVTNTSEMFKGCYNLKTLDLNGFDSSKIENMKDMFQYCTGLNKVSFGNNFKLSADASFPIPEKTASGKKAIGKWGLDSETAAKQYTAEELTKYSNERIGNLAGTWYSQTIASSTPSTMNYKISFNANGGTGSMNIQNVTKSDTLSANVFTKKGYTFTGWNTKTDGSGTSYTDKAEITLTGDMTLYAQWQPVSYSISYDLDGGSINNQKTSYTVSSGSFILSRPTKAGYTFTGWTGSNGSTPQKTVMIVKGSTGNKSYTANWKKNRSSDLQKQILQILQQIQRLMDLISKLLMSY